MDDWDAYERRNRARELQRAERLRRRGHRRRLLLGVPGVVLAAAAGYGLTGFVGGHGGPAVKVGSSHHRIASSTPPSTVATSTPGSPRPPRQITLAAVGDTMLGDTPDLPPSPATYLGGIRQALGAGIVFGNLEGTLTDQTAGKCAPGAANCYAFRAPPSYASYLRGAGFSVMNNANNHSYDFGAAGQIDTVRALHRAGIAQTGLPGEVTVVRRAGLRVGFVGFAPYPDTAPLTDLAVARALIRRAVGESDIVVVAMHAGAEGTSAQHLTGTTETYVGEDRGDPEAFAHMAIDAGADLVLGSGPHVLRAVQLYRGRLIAYSLGNFAGYHNFTTAGVLGTSAILRVTLAADGSFRGGRLVSLRLVGAGQPEIDPSGAGARLVAELTREDLGAHGARIGVSGRILRP